MNARTIVLYIVFTLVTSTVLVAQDDLAVFRTLTESWMADTGISSVLAIENMSWSKGRRGIAVVVVPPKGQKLDKGETSFDRIHAFESEHKLEHGVFGTIKRKVAAIAALPSRDVVVTPARIKFPDLITDYVQETFTIEPKFSSPVNGLHDWRALPSPDQVHRWFETKYRGTGATITVREKSLKAEELYYEVDLHGLRSKVIPGERLWEKLRVTVTMRPTVESVRKDVGNKTVFEDVKKLAIRMSIDGQYAAGNAVPRLDRYKDMEPKYVSALTNYLKPLATSLADAVTSGLP